MKIKLDKNGEPILPEGWTFLIHGTNTSQWKEEQIQADVFIVKNRIEAGLFCVERDKAIKNQKDGSNVSELHSKIKEENGEKDFEIRCLIYEDLRMKQNQEKIKSKLTEEEIKDITNYHVLRPYYPVVPNNTKLIKIATTEFDDITKVDKKILWYVPEKYLQHYMEDIQNFVEKEYKNSTNDRVEILNERGENFTKETRKLDGIEVTSTKEYDDGSYDKKSKVFVADKGIKISSDYINYTTYRQQYDAKTNTFTDKTQSPLIDKNGNVIGEQESVEIYNVENGEREINSFSTIENEKGNYHLENNSIGKGDEYKETSTLMIDNKLSGSKEKIQYINENGKEAYIYMENGVIGQKITKTEKGTTIDIYKDGKPDATYEYDENGKAIIQMAGFEQLPDDYVKNCFEVALPEYQIVMHQEPEEIYMIDEIQEGKEKNTDNVEQQISTQKLGKETIDIQKDVKKIDSIEEYINEQMREQTQEKEANFKINEFGEIIRPKREETSFRESIRFDVKTTDEYVDEVITQFEKDLENGTLEQEEIKKKYSHKVEKGDDDYIM